MITDILFFRSLSRFVQNSQNILYGHPQLAALQLLSALYIQLIFKLFDSASGMLMTSLASQVGTRRP